VPLILHCKFEVPDFDRCFGDGQKDGVSGALVSYVYAVGRWVVDRHLRELGWRLRGPRRPRRLGRVVVFAVGAAVRWRRRDGGMVTVDRRK
jgi:hypothetical protein